MGKKGGLNFFGAENRECCMGFLKGTKVLIGPSTFGLQDQTPLKCLRDAGCEVVENPYKRRLAKEELLELLADDVTSLIAGLETIDREVLEKTNLKVISRCGAGIENIDLEAAIQLGIKVCYTPLGPTTAVAELTIAALLNLLRSVHIMNGELHQGKWTKITGNQLEGKTVAIIGFGRIGKRVASLLKAFNVNIMAVDCNAQEHIEGVQACSIKEALEKADIITLHASGCDQIIGSEEFKLMKKGVFLLNSSRGGVVDEESLIEALESKKVAGVWLDTFTAEPYTGRLQDYPQALLTPHVGSYTVEGRQKMEMDAVNNLIDAFKESYDRARY